MIARGLMHLHTRASKDAELTFEEYVAFARREGLAFLLFAEHRHRMTGEEVRETAAHCDALSTGDLLLVPGQEQQTDAPGKLHVLALGVREPLAVTDPVGAVREIRERGGLAVFAHPARYDRDRYEAILAEVDGIEGWNMRYDGRVGVRESNRALLAERPSVLALAGVDAHRREDLEDPRAPRLVVELDRLDEPSLLAALRAGAFRVECAGETLELRRRAAAFRRWHAGAMRLAFRGLRGIHRRLARLGIRLPERWVRAIRRRF